MVRKVGKNRDTYDTVFTPLSIDLNTSTYTTLLVANADRLGYIITNDTSKEILIKEKAFDDPDELDRGFVVWPRTVYESPVSSVPIGEISAKAKNGAPKILIVEK